MELSDIKGFSISEIDAKLEEEKKALFNLRIERYTSGVEKPHKIGEHKRNVARLQTIRRVKEQEA